MIHHIVYECGQQVYFRQNFHVVLEFFNAFECKIFLKKKAKKIKYELWNRGRGAMLHHM